MPCSTSNTLPQVRLTKTCGSVLQVFNRASLAAVWQQQPSFLQQQVAMWISKTQRHVLDNLWPLLLYQALGRSSGVAVVAGGSGTADGSRKKGKKKRSLQ